MAEQLTPLDDCFRNRSLKTIEERVAPDAIQ